MDPSLLRSRFAGLTPGQAWTILTLTLAALLGCLSLAVTRQFLPLPRTGEETVGTDAPRARRPDTIFYRHIVDRVHLGEGYYEAVEEEFQEWDWQPFSVFHWRTPVYAWVIGLLPEPGGRALLILLSAITILMIALVVNRDLGLMLVPLTILLVGPFAWCLVDDIFLFTELWAGTLIALSVCAFALESWPAGVIAGLAALFFRELALPYCLLCLAIALWQRRRSEAIAWAAGLALFSLFFAWHTQEVVRRLSTAALQASTWVQFGGVPFVLGTVQLSNVFLINAPQWATGVFAPLSLLGLIGWRGVTGVRAGITIVGYLSAFAVIGLPFNAYWGLLTAPLLMMGFIGMPLALRDLFRSALGKNTL